MSVDYKLEECKKDLNLNINILQCNHKKKYKVYLKKFYSIYIARRDAVRAEKDWAVNDGKPFTPLVAWMQNTRLGKITHHKEQIFKTLMQCIKSLLQS